MCLHIGSRSSTDETRPDSAGGEDETIVEPEQGSGECYRRLLNRERGAHPSGIARLTLCGCGIVLSHIISQLRPGADLSRVVLPTFILEPRSMLERITKRVLSKHIYNISVGRTLTVLVMAASWRIRKPSYPCRKSMIPFSASLRW